MIRIQFFGGGVEQKVTLHDKGGGIFMTKGGRVHTPQIIDTNTVFMPAASYQTNVLTIIPFFLGVSFRKFGVKCLVLTCLRLNLC